MCKSGLLKAPFKMGFGACGRLKHSLEATEVVHRAIMGSKRHWSLYSIAILKKFRNHGIGSALCAPILTAADAEGLPCYLDTANPKSIPFFKRLGFRASKKNKSVGPDFWAMQRAPQPT
eukprot:CAMPEP_0168605722 /NCGR_PEP_ID=MMETSP0420-20121227/16148_1 /TAXON_ID=498008 /ORGANISM="Pessonella sp." /LENGTH=118 /DNA_ID=CAMNT_0008645257 /DNA_START=638 /DNA_END=990 /DNA_ORIENTATION=+